MFFIVKNKNYDAVIYAETMSELFWQTDSALGCPFDCYYYPSQYNNFSITWDSNNNIISSEGGDVMEEYDFININPNNIPSSNNKDYVDWFLEFNFYYGKDFMKYDMDLFCSEFFTKQNLKKYKKYNVFELRKDDFKICDFCKELYAGRADSRTCSRLCRVKKHRKNKKSKL